MGYNRQHSYEIRRIFQLYGAKGLIDQLPEAKGPPPNRVDSEFEEAVLTYALKSPTHRVQRTADELFLKGIRVSSGGVRGIWSRRNLLSKHERLLRLEEAARERNLKLTKKQVRPWSGSPRSFGSCTSIPASPATPRVRRSPRPPGGPGTLQDCRSCLRSTHATSGSASAADDLPSPAR